MKKFFAPMFALLVAACAVVDPSEEVGRTLDFWERGVLGLIGYHRLRCLYKLWCLFE